MEKEQTFTEEITMIRLARAVAFSVAALVAGSAAADEIKINYVCGEGIYKSCIATPTPDSHCRKFDVIKVVGTDTDGFLTMDKVGTYDAPQGYWVSGRKDSSTQVEVFFKNTKPDFCH